MKWSGEAEEAISRVPFFVRKRVKKRVEEEARLSGAHEVRLEHVEACRKKYLTNMEQEVRGYQVETCFGSAGCPNRAVINNGMISKLEEILSRKELKDFLKAKVKGRLKIHHEFRVSVSECPNACSRPQIVDIGLIGASRPRVGDAPCSHCGSCVEVCKEAAILLPDDNFSPIIDAQRCVFCGQCIKICPSGTLEERQSGYRILVGGKLGRHPQLGRELDGIYSAPEVLYVIEKCVNLYLEHNLAGERFGEILNRLPDSETSGCLD